MTEIKQSTSVTCSKEDLLNFFEQSLPLITLHSDSPSLIYHLLTDRTGQKLIKWSFYHGLYHLSWTTSIQEYRPFDYMKSVLARGPFTHFEHEQTIELRGLKTYLQDRISFRCEDSDLQKSLEGCILRYQFEVLTEERSKKATQKINAIQRKIA